MNTSNESNREATERRNAQYAQRVAASRNNTFSDAEHFKKIRELRYNAQVDALKREADEHQLRMVYLRKAFYLAGFIVSITMSIIITKAIGACDISDAVLITLATTTVANVNGILIIAFYWLYRKNRR